MKLKNSGAKSVTEGRTDLEITVCRNGVVNVRNPEYERGHTYSVILDGQGNVLRCSCKGHRFHGHCYHADEVERRPLIVSSASAAVESKPVVADGGEELPEITTHVEPEHVGGERYARCEGCGSESIFGVARILHDNDCPHAGNEPRDYSDVSEPTRFERPDMGGGETTGVVDLE